MFLLARHCLNYSKCHFFMVWKMCHWKLYSCVHAHSMGSGVPHHIPHNSQFMVMVCSSSTWTGKNVRLSGIEIPMSTTWGSVIINIFWFLPGVLWADTPYFHDPSLYFASGMSEWLWKCTKSPKFRNWSLPKMCFLCEWPILIKHTVFSPIEAPPPHFSSWIMICNKPYGR